MSLKKRLLTVFTAVIIFGAAVLLFGYITNPFGVFNVPFLSWPSYEMTKSPGTAKVTYLEEHHDVYDSYIIGCSSTSSYPTDVLNEYFNASFYNMAVYGADMLDTENFVRYLIENYEVKNLVLNVFIDNVVEYDTKAKSLAYETHETVTGENSLEFYSKYIFSSPIYGIEKLKAMKNDTYLPQSFDVFCAETGAYDQKVRDAEGIGSMEGYLEDHPVFADFPKYDKETNEDAVSGTVESIAKIKALCEDNGINFLVVCAPIYWEYFSCFDFSDIEDFYTRLAEITDYWDFSYSSVSFECRYFYDETNFRNSVGKMAIARIFEDRNVYYPDDFGVYVTKDNVKTHIEDMKNMIAQNEGEYTADVPVLMYHHIAQEGDDSTTITPELFEEHIKALSDMGYTGIFTDDLAAYVNEGKALPEKPVVITFDDGYLSNYEYAYPVLEKYGMRATIFVIGATVGNTEYYKDTEYAITPHFTYEQAKEMVSSGVISIQSHTYDMHQWAAYETGTARENILRLEGESEENYRAYLKEDCQKSRREIEEGCGEENVHAIAYPYGLYDILTQVTLIENGYDVSFTTNMGSNTVIKGLPQSLYAMNRYTMSQAVSTEQLLSWVSSAEG